MGITHENLLLRIEKNSKPVKLTTLAKYFNTTYMEVYENVLVLEKWQLVKVTQHTSNTLTTVEAARPSNMSG